MDAFINHNNESFLNGYLGVLHFLFAPWLAVSWNADVLPVWYSAHAVICFIPDNMWEAINNYLRVMTNNMILLSTVLR